MSLMEELAQNGVSAEDLEKAASVRLFEKVATEEGIEFSQLNDEQIEELYSHFVQNVLPAMSGEEGGAVTQPEGKQASAPAESPMTAAEKTASILLFQKVAADENVDLEALPQEQLEGLYAHFLENVLPTMVEEEETKQANASDVEEARAKLAEVEILGRHMARSMHDELNKMAMSGDDMKAMLEKGKDKAKEYGKKAKDVAMSEPEGQPDALKGKSLFKKKADAPVSMFDKLATDRANEILAANNVEPEAQSMTAEQFDEAVTARAVEMLQESGYTFEE